MYTREARDDLDAAQAWLTQPGSGSAAWVKLDAVLSAIEGLCDCPCWFPFGRNRGVRERLCAGGWRVFHRVSLDTGSNATAGDVRTLRVYGPGQDRGGFAVYLDVPLCLDTLAVVMHSRLKLVLILQCCVAPLYGLILLAGRHRNLDLNTFGLTFNSMLDHLLHGEWDVDPSAIGQEAFVHDGKTYAYFGLVPALLRVPITLLPAWRSVHVEMEFCLCAMLLGAGAQTYTLLTALSCAEPATRKALAPPLIAVSLLSGPAIMLAAKGPLIYHETVLWAWAWAMLFVSVALSGLCRQGKLTRAELPVISVCAGLCVLTRVTTGAGLYAAASILIVREIYIHARVRFGWRWILPCRIWSSILLLVMFLLAAAAVNEGRWHNPFQFADLHDQVFQIQLHPNRLQRLEHYGSFDPARLGIGVLYYVAPVWNPSIDSLMPLGPFLAARFDGLERPASSFLVTDPLWCAFAAYGALLTVRGRAIAGGGPLVAGLLLAPGLMLIAWYLAFRYRVEFAPLLFTLACLGIAPWAATLSGARLKRARAIVFALSILQIAATGITAAAYSRAGLGPTPGYSTLMLLKR